MVLNRKTSCLEPVCSARNGDCFISPRITSTQATEWRKGCWPGTGKNSKCQAWTVETLSRRHPCLVGGLLKSKLLDTAPIVAPAVKPTNKQTYERWWYEGSLPRLDPLEAVGDDNVIMASCKGIWGRVARARTSQSLTVYQTLDQYHQPTPYGVHRNTLGILPKMVGWSSF